MRLFYEIRDFCQNPNKDECKKGKLKCADCMNFKVNVMPLMKFMDKMVDLVNDLSDEVDKLKDNDLEIPDQSEIEDLKNVIDEMEKDIKTINQKLKT